MEQRYIFTALILLAIVAGCIASKPVEKMQEQYIDINVTQAKDMIDRGEVFILDVRRQDEFDAGHINGATLLALQDIPTQEELKNKLKELPADRKILVYCRSGVRSAEASGILIKNGFTQVYNMKDGITGWTNAGYPTTK
ncbi:MAG: rhodanese-like domain-containing protein [Candidatus Methanoperedens sp.]|nr:rhodanese-like domain-containing protein [Candidatus Methanoperedens sp.]MCE8427513.1 rhodanese-like domain-containing protein [Candidatus Methanoperedens sp.]